MIREKDNRCPDVWMMKKYTRARERILRMIKVVREIKMSEKNEYNVMKQFQ